MKRALARALTITVSSALVIASAVGLAHTAAGRPFLRAVTNVAHGGCPFGYDKAMSPAERERAEQHFAVTHRGPRKAASRPALGFELDRTTRADVLASLASRGIHCSSAKGFSDLTCNAVPSDALYGETPRAPARNLWFTFGTKQQLLSVVAMSRAAQAEPVSSAFVETERTLDHAAGAATQTRGDAAPQALAQGALRQASAEFRFTDYYALTRATNMGDGFVFTEEYRSLLD